MTAAAGPSFRDQLVKRLHESVCEHLATNGMPHCDEISQEIERLIAAEVESRVQAAANQRAAEEIERIADERTWTTEHDNEVVSTRDLYEHIARLRGELEPVTYNFPPEANDGPGPDGHHVVTGECFACMVGVATGPESHGDRCALAQPAPGDAP